MKTFAIGEYKIMNSLSKRSSRTFNINSMKGAVFEDVKIKSYLLESV